MQFKNRRSALAASTVLAISGASGANWTLANDAIPTTQSRSCKPTSTRILRIASAVRMPISPTRGAWPSRQAALSG